MAIQTNRERDKDEGRTIPEARSAPMIVVSKDWMFASHVCQVHGKVGSEDTGVRQHEIKQLAKSHSYNLAHGYSGMASVLSRVRDKANYQIGNGYLTA